MKTADKEKLLAELRVCAPVVNDLNGLLCKIVEALPVDRPPKKRAAKKKTK